MERRHLRPGYACFVRSGLTQAAQSLARHHNSTLIDLDKLDEDLSAFPGSHPDP